jgi:uncharacterized sulfatase
MHGANLLDPAAVAKRDTLYGEVFVHTAVSLTDPAANLRYRWIIRAGRKLIVPQPANTPDGKVELFYLEKDPHETKNLAPTHPDEVAALSKSLDAWWRP